MDNSTAFKSAFVTLIGRPNAGKSSLLNAIIGEQLAIVTSLPQTTRSIMKGIYTSDSMQLVFVDTPGIHEGKHAFNNSMMTACKTALMRDSADVVCYLIDLARPGGAEEDLAAKMVETCAVKKLLVFNKADLVEDAPYIIENFLKRYPALSESPRIILSATHKNAQKIFLDAITPLIPEGEPLFPTDDLTDAPMRFFAAEYLRKQVIYNTREEIPHAVFVEINVYKEEKECHRVDATIHVETQGQKGIIIGKAGSLLKKIQYLAGKEMAALAGLPVRIKCHVVVTPNWRDNQRFLRGVGIGE